VCTLSDVWAGSADGLAPAVGDLRSHLERLRLPVGVDGAVAGRAELGAVVREIDDYVLPRLGADDLPLVGVVTGSTGVGKSTLVNALAERTVTVAGVLRPTTRRPVLVGHPDDAGMVRSRALLPGLSEGADGGQSSQSFEMDVVSAPGIPAGIALVDAPDLDSVESDNRELAWRLMAAADLWLYVTSEARYADAVPWQALRVAARRGTVVAAVLDRVGPSAAAEVTKHFAQMLEANELGDAPLFVVPDAATDETGQLPADLVTPLREWLLDLAEDASARTAIRWRSLRGALGSICQRVGVLAAQADEQASAARQLENDLADAYAAATEGLAAVLRDSRDQGADDDAVLEETVQAAAEMVAETWCGRVSGLYGDAATTAQFARLMSADLLPRMRTAIERGPASTALDRVEAALASAAGEFLARCGAEEVDPELGPALRTSLRRIEDAL
jgi:hypothetical protein